MAGARVHVQAVGNGLRVQRSAKLRNAGVDARIVARIVQQQGRTEAGDLLGAQGGSVKEHRRIGRRVGHGALQGHAAPVAESDAANAAIAILAGAQVTEPADHVGGDDCDVRATEPVSRCLLVDRRAAHVTEPVRGHRQVAGQRSAPGDVFDVRIQAPVLVDDQHPGHGPVVGRGPGNVRPHLRARARVADIGGAQPLILGVHLLSPGVVRFDEWQQGRRGRGAPGELRQPAQEGTARHAAVNVVVVEVDDALIHEGIRSGQGPFAGRSP